MKNAIFKRWRTLVLLIILVVCVALTRFFTEQSGTVSNNESRGVAAYIQSAVAQHFPVNHKDVFWMTTINLLVRKAAHFSEYLLVGASISIFLNALSKKVWFSFGISTVACVVAAYLDEFRQEFIEGRTPSWFDVRIDSYGALCGIVLTTIFYVVYSKMNHLKSEIKTLEEQLSNLNQIDLK